MAEIAAARMPAARVVTGDAVPLPFADGAFDRVFTSHFYGHLLPSEREAFVSEARARGTRAGGRRRGAPPRRGSVAVAGARLEAADDQHTWYALATR